MPKQIMNANVRAQWIYDPARSVADFGVSTFSPKGRLRATGIAPRTLLAV